MELINHFRVGSLIPAQENYQSPSAFYLIIHAPNQRSRHASFSEFVLHVIIIIIIIFFVRTFHVKRARI